MQSKRGQVTLFIIIAIVIVAVVLLAIFLVPKITEKQTPSSAIINPSAYISTCINDDLSPIVEKVSNQSGYLNLEGNGIFFNGFFRRYLCYTSQYYLGCIDQEPLLMQHTETVLKDELVRLNTVPRCVNNLIENYRTKGYEVVGCTSPMFSVVLDSGQVEVPVVCKMVFTKGEEKRTFENVTSSLSWPLYDFITVSQAIIADEKIGYFNEIAYMVGHQWIGIEKDKISNSNPLYDGSIIYTLIEKSSGKTFGFAVRSKVLPRGPM